MSISFDLTDEFEEGGNLSAGYKPGRSDSEADAKVLRNLYRIIRLKTGNPLTGLQ
jgi:hypothetical protein